MFRLFGYAGSGKSTITRHAIEALGLAPMSRDGSAAGGVLFAAYTGKAALVMTRKGTPASTIHSLIYRVSEATPEEIARVDAARLADASRQLCAVCGPAEQLFAIERLDASSCGSPTSISLASCSTSKSLVRDAELIVLDEVSMVGPEMAADLLAFGKPILVLGDPGQLPPIKGAGAFTDAAPDVMLTEIHRQAGESAIIRLATMARQGEPIPYGGHDDHVWKMRRTDVDGRAAAARRPGDLRPQRNAASPQRRHETCRGI